MGRVGHNPPIGGRRTSGGALLVALLAAALAVLLLAGPAQARGETSFSLQAPAADGYKFQLFGQVRPGSPRKAFAAFGTLGRREFAFTSYTAPKAARASRKSVNVHIDPLGRVAVDFEQLRRKVSSTRVLPGCRIEEVTRIGIYTGRIDVDGEGGYPGIDRNRARGRITTLRTPGCGSGLRSDRRPPLLEARKQRTAVLGSFIPNERIALTAVRRGGKSNFLASSREQLGDLRVFRYVAIQGEGRDMVFGSKLKRAILTPPSGYFAGTGRYAARVLSGNLAVSFIGAPDVALTPGDARLTRGGGRLPFGRAGADADQSPGPLSRFRISK